MSYSMHDDGNHGIGMVQTWLDGHHGTDMAKMDTMVQAWL